MVIALSHNRASMFCISKMINFHLVRGLVQSDQTRNLAKGQIKTNFGYIFDLFSAISGTICLKKKGGGNRQNCRGEIGNSGLTFHSKILTV